jgi:hypothetical protein
MDTISNTAWQRKGSSIVFDQLSLSPFIADGSVVSLRQMLSWKNALPSHPVVPGKTILISGLETIIETMATQEAEEFLSSRIRPLLKDLQNTPWRDYGLVFGFSAHCNAFKETPLAEEVLFHRRDQKEIRLSEGLWDGSATLYMKRIVRDGDKPNSEIIAGYYVDRIS